MSPGMSPKHRTAFKKQSANLMVQTMSPCTNTNTGLHSNRWQKSPPTLIRKPSRVVLVEVIVVLGVIRFTTNSCRLPPPKMGVLGYYEGEVFTAGIVAEVA